ncbi:MAG: hypothetical protein JO250_14440 [Armatimonadetes bacterium]|nr:hypothetical protein [Armatimonadota bacterium]
MVRCACFWCLWLLSWGAATGRCADAPAPPKAVTLADALKALPQSRLPDGAVILTVAPQDVRLPQPVLPADAGPAATPDLSTLESISSAYDRSQQVFGHVMALAPPTMVTLNTDPSLTDVPLADLVGQNPLSFLLGTLTESQLHQLGGDGLGMADMTPDQQSLFLAALPHPFRITPAAATLPALDESRIKGWTPADWQKWQARMAQAQKDREAQTVTLPEHDLQNVRLRATLTADYVFDVPGQGGYLISVYPGGIPGINGGGRYALDVLDQTPGDQESRLRSYIRAEFPNSLKDGDLRWTQRALDAGVPLDNLKTAGDLTARLAQVTGLELHCDPHFAGLSLLLLGDTSHPHPADEVMQALTLCVCGAWRQVGPIYVLTDDVQGVATRRATLKDIVSVWGARLDKAAKGIGTHLAELGWAKSLSFAPHDPAALPSALRDKVSDLSATTSRSGIPIPWRDLPPSLQMGLKKQMDDPAFRSLEETSIAKVEAALRPDTPVNVTLNMRLAVVVPGYGPMPLMLNNEYRVPRADPSPAPPSGVPVKPQPILLTEKTRAVLCAPATAKQARQVVDRLVSMGFNALFCDVFTGGRTYFPNTALPPANADAGGVLAAAIGEGRKKGVAVYAVLDTLCWRTESADSARPPLPPGFAEDITLQGETVPGNIRRRLASGGLDPQTPPDMVLSRLGVQRWVSPTDARVRAVLPALVRALAGTPGLAGLAFEDTAAKGYLGGGDTGDYEAPELGYTLENRLARLRAGEADPVDVGAWGDTSLYLRSQDANVSATLDTALPLFGEDEVAVAVPWNQYRADADHALLADLYAAAREATPQMPLLMRERRIGFTFDPWTDPKQLDEAKSLAAEGNELGRHATPATILAVTLDSYFRHRLDELPGIVREFRQEFGNGVAGGLLLDLVTGSPGSDPPHDLDLLGPFFAAKAAK